MSEELLKNRIKELKKRSEERNIYTFTDFLNEESIYSSGATLGDVEFTCYGGADFAERKIVRFGKDCNGEEEFPLSVVYVMPRGKDFAQKVTHKDFLGAVISLGIERDAIGDIFTDGKSAYVVVKKTVKELVLKNLTSVGKNPVTCQEEKTIPQEFKPKTERVSLNVASLRLDCVLSKLYNLSREDAKDLFVKNRVFVFGKPILKDTYTPKELDVISVKGLGKFVFCKEEGISKKGRVKAWVLKYV